MTGAAATAATGLAPNAHFRIGVSGHRVPPKLPETSEVPLRATIDKVLSGIRAAVQKIERQRVIESRAAELVVVSSLAEGSDRIVAEAGLAAGLKLKVILPFSAGEYCRDFATAESAKQFQDLLARASEIVELPGSATERPRAYEAAGLLMLESIDMLVAIWDGQVGDGIGGTTQIVNRALAKGLPVLWIAPAQPNALKISGGTNGARAAVGDGSPRHGFAEADMAAVERLVAELLLKEIN